MIDFECMFDFLNPSDQDGFKSRILQCAHSNMPTLLNLLDVLDFYKNNFISDERTMKLKFDQFVQHQMAMESKSREDRHFIPEFYKPSIERFSRQV